MGKKPSKGKKKSQDRRIISTAFPSSNLEYIKVSFPFEGMSDEEIIQRIKEISNEHSQLYELSFQKLQEGILTINPISLLSLLSFYGLTYTKEGNQKFKSPILQHHVELIQALVLSFPINKFSSNPALPPDVQNIIDLVQDTTQSFHLRRSKMLDSSMPNEKRQRLKTLEDMRIHTQAIRNWGYPKQITRIVTKLFDPLDNDIENEIGIRISYLIDMCLNIVNITEDRLICHIKLLRHFLKAKSIPSAVKLHYESFPNIKSDEDELVKFFEDKNADLGIVKSMLLSHSDLMLPDIVHLTFDDFLSCYPIPIQPWKLLSIIKIWSLSFGNLDNYNKEHFFMRNPVWEKPIIFIDENNFFWPIVSLFFSFCLELMENIIKTSPRIYSKYEDRRGKFLEIEIEQLFKSAFPSSKIYRGSMWRDPTTNKDFENDLIVVIDSYLIIIEAKSGKVAESARRGGEFSLQRAVDELVVEPSLQIKRFFNHLRENPGLHKFSTRCGAINEIYTSNIFEFACLNITLELLPFLREGWPILRKAGFIKNDVDIAPTMSLVEIESIFEILEGSADKLHYLVRRTQFEKNAKYDGDEFDLLAFYLDTGFNVGEAEFGQVYFKLWGMSKYFDQYFLSDQSNKNKLKPRRKLTPWWRDILIRLEERKPSRWTEISLILLNVAYDNQLMFERQFNIIKKIVKQNWWKSGHRNSIISYNGPPQRQDIIVGLAYKSITKEERNEMIKDIAMQSMENSITDRALVIGINIGLNHYPYSVIGCFFK